MSNAIPPEILRELESTPPEVLAKLRAALRIMRSQRTRKIASAMGLRIEIDGSGRMRLRVVAMDNIDPEAIEAAVVFVPGEPGGGA